MQTLFYDPTFQAVPSAPPCQTGTPGHGQLLLSCAEVEGHQLNCQAQPLRGLWPAPLLLMEGFGARPACAAECSPATAAPRGRAGDADQGAPPAGVRQEPPGALRRAAQAPQVGQGDPLVRAAAGCALARRSQEPFNAAVLTGGEPAAASCDWPAWSMLGACSAKRSLCILHSILCTHGCSRAGAAPAQS